jgi:hypothetical protein
MFRFNTAFLTVFLVAAAYAAGGQQRPVGFWRAHLPNNSAQGIATDGLVNYIITGKGFFTYNITDVRAEAYSKVEGMHDTNPVGIAFDRSTGTCVIGYSSSNIDLFRNNNFKVLPDLKNKSFSGSKNINHIYADNGLAYLSTSLGIIVIDLDRQEVKETYVFSKAGQVMAINAFAADSLYYYAASQAGLFRISRNAAAPQVFANWQAVDTQRIYTKLALVQNVLFAATSGAADTIFRITGIGARQRVWYRDSTAISRLDGSSAVLYAGIIPKTGGNIIYHFSLNNLITDSTTGIGYPTGVVESDDKRIWVADLYQGMGERTAQGNLHFFVPNGPADPENIDLYAHGGEVWVAHGGINNFYGGEKKRSGLSHFVNDQWGSLTGYSYPLFYDSVFDFMNLLKDERTGTLYAGSFESGIYERKADGTARFIKQGALLSDTFGSYPVTGMAIDQNGNFWVNQYGLPNEIAVGTPDGRWYHYDMPKLDRYIDNLGIKILVDDANQKWYIAPFGGGVMVFDDAGTPETGIDDLRRNLTLGKGKGNLPSTTAISMIKDRDGAIWIGTDKGIAIVSSPGQILTDPTSDAEQRIVQYDQFAGYLFSNETVQAMAVDGANRKWIGTNNGVWLLSPDASKIISRFTVDNSPLPSNVIQSIAVDDVTGDVYFGTPDGLVSYRGTATEGSETAGSIKTFPSPVPSGYAGAITMNGFTTDADVRITDIAGQLVYRAKATGGQLVWNGLDYTGHRPQSGVLLIFATNKDGSQTATGKMMFMH